MIEPDDDVPLPLPHVADVPEQRPSPEMTRDEWIAYHVARAPKITDKQWADTLTILNPPDGQYGI
ncbi:hypothetical protein OG589_44845 [Sphaerisporangium sp. NBC_01403]|uniref:hypothetical protein n=1 Tax=Sphaerisporangium sp. NBC_01403 TaxID=2903599 RepID=UPI0032473452